MKSKRVDFQGKNGYHVDQVEKPITTRSQLSNIVWDVKGNGRAANLDVAFYIFILVYAPH